MKTEIGPQTQQKCIICLQKLTDTVPHHYPGILHNVLRYAKVKEQRLRHESLSRVCLECSTLLSRFNKLHRVFEETRLRLNHCIQDMVSAMKEADEDVKGIVSSSEFDQSAAPIRSKLLRACVDKLNSTPPLVSLKRHLPHRQAIVKTEAVELPDSDRDFASIPDDHFTSASTYKNDPDVSIKVESPLPPILALKSSHLEEEEKAPNRILKLSKRTRARRARRDPLAQKSAVRCVYCLNSFSVGYIAFHHALEHCEHHLLEYRREGVGPAQFKEIVDKILFPKLLKPLKCTLCGKAWPMKPKKETSMRLSKHLLASHLSFLRDKVVELQRDPAVLEKVGGKSTADPLRSCGYDPSHLQKEECPADSDPTSVATPTSSDIPTFGVKTKVKCSKCDILLLPQSTANHKQNCAGVGKHRIQCQICKTSLHPASLKVHQKRGLCDLILQINCDNPGGSKTLRCSKCKNGTTFKSILRLAYHQKYDCLKGEGKKSLTKSVVESRPHIKCGKCGNTILRRSLSSHLKYSCKYSIAARRRKCGGCKKWLKPDSIIRHQKSGCC